MSDSTKHWADREERGSYWLMKLTAFAAKVLGRRLLSPLLYGIVLYFFLFGRTARQSRRKEEEKEVVASARPRPPCAARRRGRRRRAPRRLR